MPPRFAGGPSPCRDRCLREAWAGGELPGRAGCGVREACVDGCFWEGLAAGLFRVGAFALGGLTIGVSGAADAMADDIAPLGPVPAPPSLVTTMMNPQYERGQQQSVGQYAEPAHGTSDMGDDLASCPEVECAASIGSAYVVRIHRPA